MEEIKKIIKNLEKEAKKFIRKKDKLEEQLWNLEADFDKKVFEASKKIDSLSKCDIDLYWNFSDFELAYFNEDLWHHWNKKTLYSTIKLRIKECLEDKKWKKENSK